MRYFRNTELAKLYGISEKTVRNWVKQAREGKLGLDIYSDEKGRFFVAETTKNTILIEEQVKENQKYRNSRTHKVVGPKDEFYQLYSWPQIYDIVGHLDKFNDFPFHYTHMGRGGLTCARYYERLHNEPILNTMSYSSMLFNDCESIILSLFPEEYKINVIELGGRTGLSIRKFLERLRHLGRIGSYIDVDISTDMIKRNKDNLAEWFKDSIPYDSFQKDIIRDRFDDVTIEVSSCTNSRNLVLLLGGTSHAFSDKKLAYSNIRESLGADDYFILSTKIDSEKSRRYFDFNPIFQSKLLPKKELFLIDILNIDPSFYEVEQFYDEKERQRKIQVRLKFDVTVKFQLKQGIKYVTFKKGETILLWRAWHQTMEEIIQEFNECGFNVMQAVKSPDEQYAMIIAKVKIDKVNHR